MSQITEVLLAHWLKYLSQQGKNHYSITANRRYGSNQATSRYQTHKKLHGSISHVS
jgi:hypothetical protein